MNDPTRWCEDESAGEARELLLAARTVKLPDPEKRALWAGIALSLPPPISPPAAPPTPWLARAGLGPYLAKGAVFLAAFGGLTLGASRLWPGAPPPAGRVAAAPSAPASTAVVSSIEPSSNVAPAAVAAPSTAPLDLKPRAAAASQLREESLALLEARAALRAGDAPRSLTLLERARGRFPRGALGQEREALTIEALAKAGQGAAAQRRARSFLLAHPSSPYAADVRRLAGP